MAHVSSHYTWNLYIKDVHLIKGRLKNLQICLAFSSINYFRFFRSILEEAILKQSNFLLNVEDIIFIQETFHKIYNEHWNFIKETNITVSYVNKTPDWYLWKSKQPLVLPATLQALGL